MERVAGMYYMMKDKVPYVKPVLVLKYLIFGSQPQVKVLSHCEFGSVLIKGFW